MSKLYCKYYMYYLENISDGKSLEYNEYDLKKSVFSNGL